MDVSIRAPPTFWMFCVGVDNDLYIVKLPVPQKNFLETFFLRVKGQVPKSDRSKMRKKRWYSKK